MKQKEKKLDIFDVLKQADLGNKDYYHDLGPEMQKHFTPLVAMRWFSAVSNNSKFNEYSLILTNEIVNMDFWTLADHPELQWKLMTLCGTGQTLRHQWIPMPKRRKINKIEEFLLRWYPSANDQELNLLIDNLTRESFEQFAKSAGTPDDELKELLKAYDSQYGKK